MPAATEAKHERLQIRLDARAKNVLQRAAGYRRKALSQFVLGAALEEAERVIQENEVATLSGADWQVFYDALANPPAPNTTLREAFTRYRRANG